MDYLKDKHLLLPIIEKSDFLHTKLRLHPNHITLFNSYVITSLLVYSLLNKLYFYSFFLMQTRNILDGVDGYIARKYDKKSELGHILDHTSDSFFIAIFNFIFLYKLNLNIGITILLANIVYTTMILFNFTTQFQWIGKMVVGAGGGYDSYCTITYLSGIGVLMIVDHI